MNTQAHDVIVIGGGVAGACCAYYLTAAGVDDVLVLEEAQPASKASGRAAGFLTPDQFLSTGTHVDAHAFLLSFWEQIGTAHGLPLHYADAYTIARRRSSVAYLERLDRETGVDSRVLTADALTERIPSLEVGDIEAAFAYPDGMHCDPHLATTIVLEVAMENGVELRRECATSIDATDSVTAVETTDRTYTAPHVVLAAGAWSKALARTAGISLPLKPRVSQIAMLAPARPVELPLINDPDLGVYYRTEPDGDVLLGGGTGTTEVDPDDFDTTATEAFLLEVAETAPTIAAGLAESGIASSWAGRCSATPDRHPLVGPSGIDGLLLCCGFNGEGLMYAPVAGRRIADLITGRQSPFATAPYDPARFSDAEPDFRIKSAIEW